MPTRTTDRPGLSDAAKAVAEHATSLARLELELAGTEVKQKLKRTALGVGLVVGAATVGWIALLLALAIVFGGAFGLAGILGLAGLAALKRGTPPVPEQAIEEARRTAEALRSTNGRH
jgi:Putative Actinobacterial Holin-X, holin superfamily III